MITHYAFDVPKDGNCFYTCTVRTCGNLLGVGTNETAVQKLRNKVAEALHNNSSVEHIVEDLLSLIRECPQLKSDFPFLANKNVASTQLVSLAARVAKNGVWASEIEHSVVKHMLSESGVDLITLECTNKQKLYSDCDIENQLAIALASTTKERCVVLIHISNNHYMYMTLGHDRIPLCEDFRDHIRVFLEEDSSDDSSVE